MLVDDLIRIFINSGDGFIIVYSINNRKSFENVDTYINKIIEYYSLHHEDLPIVLIGNKNDKEFERQVNYEEGFSKANDWNCSFFEISALEDKNLLNIFHELVNAIDLKYSTIYNNKKKKGNCILL